MLEDLGAYQEVENIRAAIISDPEVYRSLPVKPRHKEEWSFYESERRPKGELFSRLDHIKVRHGEALKQLFETEDDAMMIAGIVDTLKASQDQYRDKETKNLVYYNEKNNMTVIVKDVLSENSTQNPPPPPPYITTAYTLDGGKSAFEYRKANRAIH